MSAEVRVAEVVDAGDDVLIVRGYVGEDWYEAQGWLSAMEQHHPPEHYHPADHPDDVEENTYTDADGNEVTEERRTVLAGHRREGTEPRAMTEQERRAYWERLLLDQAAASERVIHFDPTVKPPAAEDVPPEQ